MSEWISVKDRYPQDNQEVKIKVKDTQGNQHELKAIFKDCEDYRSWSLQFPDEVMIHAKPTHWMPLPAPPEEERLQAWHHHFNKTKEDFNNFTNNSEFYHFGLLPQVCIHSPIEDEYSKMYSPRKKCDCGNTEWLEEGCTMILGHYPDSTPMYKDVHRCKKCNEVRMADHVSLEHHGPVQ